MHCQLSLTSFPLHSELGRANNVHMRYYCLQYPITKYTSSHLVVRSKKKAYKQEVKNIFIKCKGMYDRDVIVKKYQNKVGML